MPHDPKTRAPDFRDRHVGQSIRSRRNVLGMSQGKLAQALGITFQQVQKYEKGSNRISSSRLADVAAALGVSIASFYEGIDSDGMTTPPDPVAALLVTREGVELARAFVAIADARQRRSLVELAKAIVASRPA